MNALYTGPTTADLACIPEDLKDLRQWVFWRGVEQLNKKTGEVKLTKIPCQRWVDTKASTTIAATWCAFMECAEGLPTALRLWQHAYEDAYRGGGIGFVFTAEDPYAGIDLDHCRDPESGTIEDWAQTIIDNLDSYTEVTPSGTGVHILVQGTVPTGRNKKGHIEMYDRARFFTMTGWHLDGTPTTIHERQDALDALHKAVFAQERPASSPQQKQRASPSLSLADAELLNKAKDAGNGGKFARLFAGDRNGYATPSEADLALCDMLAFWTEDPAQLDRLFRQSDLMREKWDEKRGAQTYGAMTITKALAQPRARYSGDLRQRRNGHPTAAATSREAPDSEPAQHLDTEDWYASLLLNQAGNPTENVSNITRILEQHPVWRGRFWFDTVRLEPMLDTKPLDDASMVKIARWLGDTLRMPVRSLRLVERCVLALCADSPRDLLRKWLEDLQPWDGVPRLDHWLSDVAEAPRDAYGIDVSRLLPVSMVARALAPGGQYRFVVILEGDEDSGKSKLIRTLASPEWYVELSMSLESKEAHMMVQGVWVAELGELESLSRTEESRLKAFLTMQEDVWVPKYSNLKCRRPRRTIFIGTTNEDSYLKGQTGNTRFLPIHTGHIDCAILEAMREQLFAEALVHYREHPEDWWQLSSDAASAAILERERRREDNVYEDELGEWLETKRFTTKYYHEGDPYTFRPGETSWFEISRFFLKLEKPADWMNVSRQREIGKALRKKGWKRDTPKDDERKTRRIWIKNG